MARSDSFHSFRARVMRKVARGSFRFLERHLDVHLTPNDYYSPIPSLKDLPVDAYDRPYSLAGIEMDDHEQLALLERLARYREEYAPKANGGLSLVDAFLLYALVRERKPKRMIEIGGGDSTFISMDAVERNRIEGYSCHFTCIEPYPRPFLRHGKWQDYELIEREVQDVPGTYFADADMVFIDSSHVSKIGSDVNHELFEIVPSTKVGCLIHWHDIVIPTNYWRDWTEGGVQFWNESYLLHAFLLFNSAFRIRWASRYMKLQHGDLLRGTFPYLIEQHRLTSCWVERVA